MLKQIKLNNQNHEVNQEELNLLTKKAQTVYQANFDNLVWFERSIFINWTCAIADCKYCYLSTKPKHKPNQELKALRSKESILAETLVCKVMGWKVGYITGGLRVESTDYLINLIDKIDSINGQKIMMNFGPYSRNLVEKFKPHVLGMGSAIESFDEELHNFICPSKPLKSLLRFLGDLKDLGMEKLITIILGLGEKKEDVLTVIENIKKYNIEKVQLCFLKPQENTIFDEVPPPNMRYMAYWVAKIRVACPKVIIKVALVKERVEDFSLLLEAGANCFSRFLVFNDFKSKFSEQLEEECKKADRKLVGHFNNLPQVDLKKEVSNLSFDEEMKEKILVKAEQYWKKLSR